MGWFYVRVLVTVGPDGGVRAANISKSSGNMMSDLAALRAARASSYAPKVVNCVAVTGDYMFRAEFNPYTPSPSPTLQ